MKRLVFIFFLFLCGSFTVNAQTSETVSELTPVPANTGKFSGKLPKYESYYEPSKIEFDVKVELVNLPDGKKGIAVTVQTLAEELVFEPIDGKPTAKINIYGRITSKDKTTDGFFEEKIIVDEYSEDDLAKSDKNPITLRKVFHLPEGKYQIVVIVRDNIVTSRGIEVVKFQISNSDTIK